MSLSLEPTHNSIPLANCYEDGKHNIISYIDRDDLPEDAKLLGRIRLNDKSDSFFPLIKEKNDESGQNIYISGPTGCGKSTFIRLYIMHFLKKYPKAPVLLFTCKQHDKKLDDIKQIKRVRIDTDMLQNKMTLQEISAKKNPFVLCIFDDIEDFPDKKLNIEINRLCNEVIRCGRSYGCITLYVNHDSCAYNQTKLFIKEATQIVMMPYRAPKSTYDLMMSHYLKLDNKTQNLIKNVKSDFVAVNRSRPECIIADKYIILL